jgi:putative glutamine amidotransferase
MRPTIGITTYHTRADWRGPREDSALLPWTYVKATRAGGGIPVLLPPGGIASDAEDVVSVLDGIVIVGGEDINPVRYGARPHPKTEATVPERDEWELAVAAAAIRLNVPLLGICRGMQVVNIACGGTLHQHVPDLVGHEGHNGPADGYGTHKVRITAGELLASILPSPGEYFEVATHHHQAVDLPGAGLTAVGWADDGIIEAIESTSGFTVGVQWHPEQGTDERLFAALVRAAELRSSERAVEAMPAIPSELPELLADA